MVNSFTCHVDKRYQIQCIQTTKTVIIIIIIIATVTINKTIENEVLHVLVRRINDSYSRSEVFVMISPVVLET